MDCEENNSEPDGSKTDGDKDKENNSEPRPSTSKHDETKKRKKSKRCRERRNSRRSSEPTNAEAEEVVIGISGTQEDVTQNLDCQTEKEDVTTAASTRPYKNLFSWTQTKLNRYDSSSSSSEDDGDDIMDPERSTTSNRRESGFFNSSTNEIPGAERFDSPSSPSSSTSSTGSSRMSRMSIGSNGKIDPDAIPDVLLKPKPKHKWFATPEIVSRQIGYSNRLYGPKMFEERMYGSLHAVQRLELMYKLENHTGCVNSLNFNSSGSLLVSCSDDLSVCIWQWTIGHCLSSIETGHKSNVFQAKFLPLQGHIFLGTCARDGQVRILELNSDGSLFNRRLIGQHHRPAHKIALVPDSPHVFLSSGEDSVVLNVDIRQNKATRVLSVMEDGSKIPLYSVSCHPLDSNEFMVGGRDPYLRIYDRRNASHPTLSIRPNPSAPVQCHYITCAVYNYIGSEMLATYNDEDIYLWDRRDTASDFVHKYQGHRNSATIKGVNFFGPRSEFVMSGSDCGNIYIWEKETEAIVQWMAGDENGVINCLEPHPTVPVLATSGLDEDAKIWVPSNEKEPTFDDLKSSVIINQKDREDERVGTSTTDMDGQMLWLLWRHINRVTRRMGTRRDSGNHEEDSTPTSRNVFQSSTPELTSDDDDDAGPSFTYSDCSPS